MDFPNNEIISYVYDFSEAKESQRHIYLYPILMTCYGHITNNFPGELFNYVRAVALNDEHHFAHEFFNRIQKSFPFMEKLSLINHKSVDAIIKSYLLLNILF
ncbi:unnamed protein product [Rotaria magnacalcarata]|uniref:Uncharacterized protein n=2 Tax=Rotaria magnacalcarata TaxID=392030 RepID=A0A815WVQ7_9BILA|nr:unnamed protein product [Rotaria magnacalcarata]CAF4112330.1 unnamed protein product [Rotaria magnacalcarata]